MIVNGILFGYYGKSKEVTIPESVTRIESYSFKGIESVVIHKNVCAIGVDAFKKNSLKTVCFQSEEQKDKFASRFPKAELIVQE